MACHLHSSRTRADQRGDTERWTTCPLLINNVSIKARPVSYFARNFTRTRNVFEQNRSKINYNYFNFCLKKKKEISKYVAKVLK